MSHPSDSESISAKCKTMFWFFEVRLLDCTQILLVILFKMYCCCHCCWVVDIQNPNICSLTYWCSTIWSSSGRFNFCRILANTFSIYRLLEILGNGLSSLCHTRERDAEFSTLSRTDLSALMRSELQPNLQFCGLKRWIRAETSG